MIKFVSLSSQAMISMPHIYLSALPWVPTNTELARTLRERFNHQSLITGNLPGSWDVSLETIHYFKESVYAVVPSLDGRYIAVVAGRNVFVSNMVTG